MGYVCSEIHAGKDVDLDVFVLQGAGTSNGANMYRVMMADAEATGASSCITKAKDRVSMADEMISAMRVRGTTAFLSDACNTLQFY